MKNRNVLKNNRGAALVSIMVAVAFVTILATAILSMSYNNFRMKVVNYESKANFYETEQRLTVMSSKLRNDVMSSSTPLTEIQELTGVDSAADPENKRYSALEIAKLAFPGVEPQGTAAYATVSFSGDTFAFYSLQDSGANYLEEDAGAGLKKVTLKAVAVNQVEGGTNNQNTIKTDLVMYIRENSAPSDMGGVGEFSVLMDGGISSTDDFADGTRINMFGNTFFMGTNFSTDHSEPGTGDNSALVLGGNYVYNMLGGYNFIFGDVVLDGNATLNVIGGSLTVYGNIYLYGNSALTCSGKLFMPCADRGSFGINVQENDMVSNHVYPSDLVDRIEYVEADKCDSILSALKLNDADESNDGVMSTIFVPQAPVGGGEEHYVDDSYFNGTEETTLSKASINGIEYQTRAYIKPNEVENGSSPNSLLFLGPNITMRESNEYATIMSRYSLKFDQAHSIYLTKMGSYAFNYMTLTSGSELISGNYKYDPSVHQIKMGDGNFYEVGGFISSDANSFMNSLMGYAVNNGGGDTSYTSTIGYQNWSKE